MGRRSGGPAAATPLSGIRGRPEGAGEHRFPASRPGKLPRRGTGRERLPATASSPGWKGGALRGGLAPKSAAAASAGARGLTESLIRFMRTRPHPTPPSVPLPRPLESDLHVAEVSPPAGSPSESLPRRERGSPQARSERLGLPATSVLLSSSSWRILAPRSQSARMLPGHPRPCPSERRPRWGGQGPALRPASSCARTRERPGRPLRMLLTCPRLPSPPSIRWRSRGRAPPAG